MDIGLPLAVARVNFKLGALTVIGKKPLKASECNGQKFEGSFEILDKSTTFF